MKHLLQMWITTLHYITKFPLETYPDVVAMYNKGSHHYLQNETANKRVILFHWNSQFLNTRTDWSVMNTFLEILQFLPCNRVRRQEDQNLFRVDEQHALSTSSWSDCFVPKWNYTARFLIRPTKLKSTLSYFDWFSRPQLRHTDTNCYFRFN